MFTLQQQQQVQQQVQQHVQQQATAAAAAAATQQANAQHHHQQQHQHHHPTASTTPSTGNQINEMSVSRTIKLTCSFVGANCFNEWLVSRLCLGCKDLTIKLGCFLNICTEWNLFHCTTFLMDR